jgi:hypothetical protein
MIPRGRPVVDAAGAAAILGMAYKTFRNTSAAHQPGFPDPVNPGRRKALYDEAQVRAYAARAQPPDLPAGDHPRDLLDEQDAAELLGVAYATVRKDRQIGRLPEPVIVCGLAHWPRATLQQVPTTMRPGRGVGGGRPKNAVKRK